MLAALGTSHTASSQVIDLYSRMSDPRAIARLDEPDTSCTKAVTFHGDAKWNIDSIDHIPDVAKDTGSGVITHIWTTADVQDSSVTIWLYLNDTLVISDHYYEFFEKLRGLFRPPLNLFANGANTWDVQIPYHKGFRLAMLTPNGNVYFAVEWHEVRESLLPWIALRTLSISPTQTVAETRYQSQASPWHDNDVKRIERLDTLPPQSRTVVADIDGPAMLESMRFIPASYDFAELDSLWLNIYWDKSPVPSVHVPLKDFFLSPVNVTKAFALQLHADRDSGFICYFPMPFAVHARVELARSGSSPLSIRSTFQYHLEPVDRNAYGYFHADFSESNPTKYHVWHPVIHTIGRGRYIGMSWGVMEHPYYVFLEGNPRFQVDSDAAHFIEYTGGEDYFDAGWWFANGPFTLPFTGYTDVIDQFYRFHYMDCYEFNHSFDFDFQPGGNADIYDHFRTVGYYYKHNTPFWTNRDTLVSGENWTIAGSGYSANQKLPIMLGTESLSVTTNNSGDFSISLSVPSSWTAGIYSLSVNGETAPEKYYVLRTPAIRALVDTLPVTLRAGDSLWVKGIGFQPGETVSFYLDSIPLGQSIITNSNNEFIAMLRMPYIGEHTYLLVARGSNSGNATAQDRITITRVEDIEFEDMMPPTFQTPGLCYAENVSYFWEAMWSKQMFVYFKPDTVLIGAQVEFQFPVSHADTFAIAYRASVGPDLGRYSIELDGDSLAAFDEYANTGVWMPYPLPSGALPLGIQYLAAGPHRIRFTCLGKADSSTNYYVEPDCLVLRPTTYMPPTPGTILASVDTPNPPSSGTFAKTRSLEIYPNPIESNTASISLILSEEDAPFFSSRISIRAFDILGRETAAILQGHLANDQLTGTFELPNAIPGTYFIRLLLSAPDGRIMILPLQRISVE